MLPRPEAGGSLIGVVARLVIVAGHLLQRHRVFADDLALVGVGNLSALWAPARYAGRGSRSPTHCAFGSTTSHGSRYTRGMRHIRVFPPQDESHPGRRARLLRTAR